MAVRPSGTVTFLFSDIEGSTLLLRELGAEQYGNVLQEHRRFPGVRCGRRRVGGALSVRQAVDEALGSGVTA